jgi:periplasmic protein TonB
MSIEPGPIPIPHNEFGSLQGCFVEGSPEQRKRERRIRRRALIISVAAQAAIVTAIILVPLFGKPERIALANPMPIPPYYPSRPATRPESPARPSTPHQRISSDKDFFQPPHIPARIDVSPDPASPEPTGIPAGLGPGAPCTACIPIDDGRRQPERPAEVRPQTPHRLIVTHLEPAMLIQRVEPIYPTLPKQMHREGQVELRAVIAIDGSIQSLQVVSGDPLFLRSATDAVSQWRYHPTVLNGQPVEIETYITIIYTLQH